MSAGNFSAFARVESLHPADCGNQSSEVSTDSQCYSIAQSSAGTISDDLAASLVTYSGYPRDMAIRALDLVVDHILLESRAQDIFREPYKHTASRISLTCRRWTYTLRPVVFRRIILWSPKDVAFLLALLRSPISKWLAGQIKAVMLDIRVPAGKNQHAVPLSVDLIMWRELVSLTMSLKALCFSCSLLSTQPFFPHTHRLALKTIRTLKHLALTNVRFHSLSALIGLIGSFEELQGVYLDEVRWKATSEESISSLKAPRCKAIFKNLWLACWDNCTDSRAVAWIFLAKSLNYEYSFRDEVGGLPRDFESMMKLLSMCYHLEDRRISMRQVVSNNYIRAFSVRVPYASDDLPTVSNYTSVTFVTRPVPTDPNGTRADSTQRQANQHFWALQHFIISYAHTSPAPMYFDPPIGPSISTMDQALAEFPHLLSVDLFYRKDIEVALDVELAESTIRTYMPVTRRIVKLREWPSKGRTLLDDDLGLDFQFDPFEEWWRSDWTAEI